MITLSKSIEIFSEDKYRDLPYGTIYYVAGTASAKINDYALSQIESIEKRINQNASNWVTCKIVYLAEDNPFFPAQKKATLYSALIPIEEYLLAYVSDIYYFLGARLDITETALIETAMSDYFSTLQQMLDELMDTGEYKEYHLKKSILSPYDELSGIRFSINQARPDIVKEEDDSASRVMFSIVSDDDQHYDKPSRLEITPNIYKVLLPDFGTEIRFTTQAKALYILFLNHPEGIRMKEIADYKEEFKHIYFCITTRSDTDRLRNSVDRLLDVCNRNTLDVKKSQCNSAICLAVPDRKLFHYYEIEVNRGQPHKVNLDRSLVSMPEILRA